MQRPNHGNPAPAQTPPLHHPVPQHVSTVPQLRSPPPSVPQPQHQPIYGNPYQPQVPPVGASSFGGYGNYITDPTTQMGFQVGQTALKHGTDYMEQNVSNCLKCLALNLMLTYGLVQLLLSRLSTQALLQSFKWICCQ